MRFGIESAPTRFIAVIKNQISIVDRMEDTRCFLSNEAKVRVSPGTLFYSCDET
jgi:hypothetical protein